MTLRAFVDRTVERVRRAPVDFRLLHPEAIPGNLVSGAAGVAFFLHEAARLEGDPRLADRAAEWTHAARKWAKSAPTTAWKWEPNGFLCGAGGLAFVEALGGDETHFGTLEKVADTELYGGAGGALVAALGLRARGHDSKAVTRLFAKMKRTKPSKNPMLGMAHGRAGETWARLHALGIDDARVKADLAELWSLRRVDDEGRVYWLPTASSTDGSLIETWCHGMAGHSLLWTEAARRSKRHRAKADAVAESALTVRSGTPSLCCGYAGHAIALQRYAELSGDARFARTAHIYLDRAAGEVAKPTWRKVRFGLWQGALGVALAGLYRAANERAFPLIEPITTSVSSRA